MRVGNESLKSHARNNESRFSTASMGGSKGLKYTARDRTLDDGLPPIGANHAFDHAGAQLGDLPGRHEEDGEHLRPKVAVDVAHGNSLQ
jgi:hypothetical protein